LLSWFLLSLFLSNDRKPCSAIRNGRAGSGSDTYLLDKLNGLSTDLGFSVYTNEINGRRLCNYTPLMVGTAGLPHVIVRFHG
jgi:cation/acetate symporter